MKFMRPSWKKIEGMCKALAGKTKGFTPDWIVGVSRGGLVPTRLLSDLLGIANVNIIRVEFYKSIGETRDFPKITQPVQVDVSKKKVLIVDDVADTGRSLAVAKEHIKRAGASQVKIATLHYKPSSILKPDYFVEQTDAWIVYPWEKKETEMELKKINAKKKR